MAQVRKKFPNADAEVDKLLLEVNPMRRSRGVHSVLVVDGEVHVVVLVDREVVVVVLVDGEVDVVVLAVGEVIKPHHKGGSFTSGSASESYLRLSVL
eukprot:6491443-Amphidinium_carterae.2